MKKLFLMFIFLSAFVSCGEPNKISQCEKGFEFINEKCVDINECLINNGNCDVNATCENSEGSFSCICKTGFEGDGKSCTDVDECLKETDNCNTNATCSNTEGSFTCECKEGFFGNGTICNDINECNNGSSDCDINANCGNIEGSFNCVCKDGFIGDGKTCDDIDECLTGLHNCETGFECKNNTGSFTCEDINECEKETDNCESGFVCENRSGSFVCNDINECENGLNNCSQFATCANNEGSFTCTCINGYSGDGITCETDECANNTDNCNVNAICTNTIGSFTCACKSGYSGDGVNCTEIDECTNGTSNCSANANCTNTAGSFTCACKNGYSGNGVTCTDINECTNGTNNCSTNANCTNNEGSFTCECKNGYSGNGITCTDVNECTTNTDNCDTNANCTNTTGSFTCACKNGYSGNGVTCTDINECTNNTHNCQTGYTCVNTSGSFICNDTDECLTGLHNCTNGQTCLNTIGSFVCDTDECANNTDNCSVNATCTNTTGSFTCVCNQGYSGNGVICTTSICGNNIANDGEECDGSDLKGNTCLSFGYSGGVLSCNNCQYITNNCRITELWGTSSEDYVSSVAVDSSGNVFVTGSTYGGLDGNIDIDGINFADIFITKFDNTGNKLWTKQWGTPAEDYGNSVAVDSSGNVFVTGYTDWTLDGNTNAGSNDIFLTKFDNHGNKQWTKQWGTMYSDIGYSVAIDNSGNVFVTGSTYGGLDGNIDIDGINFADIFITKFDNTGNKLWTKQLGSDGQDSNSIQSLAIDSDGNLFITAYFTELFNGFIGAVVIKLDNQGNQLWIKQGNSQNEQIAVDINGNAFVSLDKLIKFDSNGTKKWTLLYPNVTTKSIAIDFSGNIFVTGSTWNGLDGNTNAGSSDIFLIKYNSSAVKKWSKLWGKSQDDYGNSVAVDSSENIFVTGQTINNLDGNINAGSYDIFLTKFEADNNRNECKLGLSDCTFDEICFDTPQSFTCNSNFCGNDIVFSEEECDGNNLVSETCSTLGYSAGDLTCKSTCEYKTSDCRITKQWGTTEDDSGYSVAVDSSGNVFVTGSTRGELDGNTNSNVGYEDIFLTKFDNAGNKLWTKQWGTTSIDYGKSVAVDNSGNVFVTGYTDGGLDGNTNAGSSDIFLTKFDNAGNKLWTKQWGTAYTDAGFSIIVDSLGNVFVTGYTGWTLDGNTNAGSNDIFLTKFDNAGNKLWTKQWGTTSSDEGNSVAVDSSGNIFITGSTSGGLDGNTNAGISDIFLTKWDNNGNKLWTKQWGTAETDVGFSVIVDNSGNIFITGSTSGGLDGNTNAGSSDIFLTKWSNSGVKQWTKQWGTTSYDYGKSVAVDSSGNVFVTGYTGWTLDGNTNAGSSDIFLTKFWGE